MIDLRDPEDVAYVKDLGSLFFMTIAAIWLLHSMFHGNTREIKNAVSAA